eukprot:2349567-Rhodomonas_salina.1
MVSASSTQRSAHEQQLCWLATGAAMPRKAVKGTGPCAYRRGVRHSSLRDVRTAHRKAEQHTLREHRTVTSRGWHVFGSTLPSHTQFWRDRGREGREEWGAGRQGGREPGKEGKKRRCVWHQHTSAH